LRCVKATYQPGPKQSFVRLNTMDITFSTNYGDDRWRDLARWR